MTPEHGRTDPFAGVRTWREIFYSKRWWHSFELPDGTRIDGVNSMEGQKHRISQFPIPQDLRGKRVLDIGAWDGWFSFEMEKRGAEVMAVDNWDNPRFHEIHRLLGSRVDYRRMDMYDMTPERIGRFDIVLFMGVLYHLKHPLLALERVCALTTGMAAVDSFVLRNEHLGGRDVQGLPLMAFYETDEFAGQSDNWVGPSLACLLAFCRTAGFARVELQSVIAYSACVACYRHWEPPAPTAPMGPAMLDAFDNRTGGINFKSASDSYLTAFFDWPAENLGRDEVKPEVCGYGVRPLDVWKYGDGRWQAEFKLPPGLASGWQELRVRIEDSQPSNALRIAIDVPFAPGAIRMTGVCDGVTWAPNKIDLQKGEALSLWIGGLPENADRDNVRVYLSGMRLDMIYIGQPDANGIRQLNVIVPPETEAGVAQLVAVAGEHCCSVEIAIGGLSRA